MMMMINFFISLEITNLNDEEIKPIYKQVIYKLNIQYIG